MTGMFDELFQPGRRHLEEEQNRLALTRDEPGDADPGRGPIDLDAGVVVVRARSGDEGVSRSATGSA
nr:DUF6191 domain-containing protein [Actinacidiphila oryziradicis]